MTLMGNIAFIMHKEEMHLSSNNEKTVIQPCFIL